MSELFGPAMREAFTIIGILLNVIIGLLLYIFQQQVARTKEDVDSIKAANRRHEEENKDDMREIADALVALKDQIANLHITLPSEYVKQSVIATMQMDLKADFRSVFRQMDEMKDILINMGADRRKS